MNQDIVNYIIIAMYTPSITPKQSGHGNTTMRKICERIRDYPMLIQQRGQLLKSTINSIEMTIRDMKTEKVVGPSRMGVKMLKKIFGKVGYTVIA